MDWSNLINNLFSENKDLFFDPIIENLKKQTFNLFQIDYEHYMELKFLLIYKCNVQPSEIERMEYFDLEMLVEEWKKFLEKEKQAKEEEEKKSKGQSFTQEKYMQQAQKMTNSYGLNKNNMPSSSSTKSFSNINLPNMPKSPGNFTMPKF